MPGRRFQDGSCSFPSVPWEGFPSGSLLLADKVWKWVWAAVGNTGLRCSGNSPRSAAREVSQSLPSRLGNRSGQ